jgi:hypothetical protein
MVSLSLDAGQPLRHREQLQRAAEELLGRRSPAA